MQMLDQTSELFKGELGSLDHIMKAYSLKELDQLRTIRIERKMKEQEEQEKARKREEKKQQRIEAGRRLGLR